MDKSPLVANVDAGDALWRCRGLSTSRSQQSTPTATGSAPTATARPSVRVVRRWLSRKKRAPRPPSAAPRLATEIDSREEHVDQDTPSDSGAAFPTLVGLAPSLTSVLSQVTSLLGPNLAHQLVPTCCHRGLSTSRSQQHQARPRPWRWVQAAQALPAQWSWRWATF